MKSWAKPPLVLIQQHYFIDKCIYFYLGKNCFKICDCYPSWWLYRHTKVNLKSRLLLYKQVVERRVRCGSCSAALDLRKLCLPGGKICFNSFCVAYFHNKSYGNLKIRRRADVTVGTCCFHQTWNPISTWFLLMFPTSLSCRHTPNNFECWENKLLGVARRARMRANMPPAHTPCNKKTKNYNFVDTAKTVSASTCWTIWRL